MDYSVLVEHLEKLLKTIVDKSKQTKASGAEEYWYLRGGVNLATSLLEEIRTFKKVKTKLGK